MQSDWCLGNSRAASCRDYRHPFKMQRPVHGLAITASGQERHINEGRTKRSRPASEKSHVCTSTPMEVASAVFSFLLSLNQQRILKSGEEGHSYTTSRSGPSPLFAASFVACSPPGAHKTPEQSQAARITEASTVGGGRLLPCKSETRLFPFPVRLLFPLAPGARAFLSRARPQIWGLSSLAARLRVCTTTTSSI